MMKRDDDYRLHNAWTAKSNYKKMKDWEEKFDVWTEYEDGTDVFNKWDTFPESRKPIIAGDFWYKVTRSLFINSGLISEGAMSGKKKTPDHFVSPRMWYRAMMSTPDIREEMKNNKVKYAESYLNLHTIVKVTKAENSEVRYKNRNHELTIPELTVDKYKKFRWFNGETGNFITEGTFPLENLIPDWFTEYEKTLLVENV